MPLLYKYDNPRDQPILLTILGVDDGKQEVFARLGIKEIGAQYFHFPLNDEFMANRGYDMVYFKQLISEHRVTRVVGGMVVTAWEPLQRDIRNEALDLRVYNLACLKSCIGKSGESFWTKRLETVKSLKRTEETPKPKLSGTNTTTENAAPKRSRSLDIWT